MKCLRQEYADVYIYQKICFDVTIFFFFETLNHFILHMFEVVILEIVNRLPTVIIPQTPSGYVM